VGTPVEGGGRTAAAFFDLDKTIISRSSTLAFAPSFYRHGLITRSEVMRGACAQLIFRLYGADHRRMERIRSQISQLCRGWPADRVGDIVTRHLEELIVPHLYAEALALLAGHREAGRGGRGAPSRYQPAGQDM
jgi:phosphoserine phosphatase